MRCRAAEIGGAFDQRDGCAGLRSGDGGGHSGRAAAGNDDVVSAQGRYFWSDFMMTGVLRMPIFIDLDFHHVAVFEELGRRAREADAFRRAARDNVARFEREPLREIRDDLLHVEDHLRGVGVLLLDAVHAQHDLERSAGRRYRRRRRSTVRADTIHRAICL